MSICLELALAPASITNAPEDEVLFLWCQAVSGDTTNDHPAHIFKHIQTAFLE